MTCHSEDDPLAVNAKYYSKLLTAAGTMIVKFLSYAGYFRRMRGVVRQLREVDRKLSVLVPDEIEETIDRLRDRTAFLFEGQSLTFGDFDDRANRIADWALKQGLSSGDTVALVAENSPDYIAIWFGLSKVGVSTALINSNLEGQGLAHCINIIDAKAVIAGGEQTAHVEAVLSKLEMNPPLWDMDGRLGSDFEAMLRTCSSERPSRDKRSELGGTDTCIYIFTSGTTGLPKAARISHARFRRAMRLAVAIVDVGPEDIVYNVLPLYHITGGGLGVGATMLGGATMHLRRRFSASAFWDDVADSGATIFVYIGELCRYLINSPEHPKERQHKLKAGMGNGLRGDVWAAFVERFNVPSMREFYGSTEGNVSFVNTDGTIGTIGQSPRLLDSVTGVAFVRFDVDTEEPVRGKNGYCIRCEANEVGEVLGRIKDTGRAVFEGYQDDAATQKKILTNVFKKGDRWFRTGDLMSRDELGYVRFVDRIGDTFRWKGENVSTNEVADVISKFDGVELANVYGVQVPHTEGRAGMAWITTQKPLDYGALAEHLMGALPSYAVPIFIRESQEADTTGTFKFRKVDAVKDGFNPGNISDPLLILDANQRAYKPLTEAVYAQIVSGERRL